MGMIWTAYRMDDDSARELTTGLVADDTAAWEKLEGIQDAQGEQMLDVDKAWHALDRLYAAAGTTSPISTGRAPDSEDVVVGCVDAARVKAIVAGMGRITPAILKRGYDAKRFTREGVYPEIWDEEDVLDVYVMPYDAELRQFYRAAAEADEAVVWYLN